MLRRLSLAGVLALAPACTAGSGDAGSGDPPSASSSQISKPELSDADQALIDRAYELVTRSQLAGFVDHDLDAYMAPWAPGAKLIVGRDQDPGPHDVVLDREQLRASKAIRFAGAMPPGLLMKHALVGHELGDGVVSLRLRTKTRSGGGSELMGEVFTVEVAGDELRIVENRAWPILAEYDGQRTEFAPEFWAKHDAEVSSLVERGELRRAAALCATNMDLGRWRELAEQVAVLPDADAAVWADLAWARLITGAVTEAKAAADKARSLDPQLALPIPGPSTHAPGEKSPTR